MAKIYNTKQKKELEALIESKGHAHFTAEEISNEIKEQGKNIGLTTVYRYLEKMVNEGNLRKYITERGESACYQRAETCNGHFHLKCTLCGKLIHLSCNSLDIINNHVESEHGFMIDSCRTVFYGVCKECGRK